jgi:hypothetical protein
MKNFRFPHWEGAELQIGAQAFNVLNHPNFDQPVGDMANPQLDLSTEPSPLQPASSELSWAPTPALALSRSELNFASDLTPAQLPAARTPPRAAFFLEPAPGEIL